ncbi:MAG: 30S ribosomal protein S8 [candidate division Zixibacteria bacterium CG_4_9_14_3_um_filter_46_8]|nr:MAG: 30S ribosomal protein S8 [candidate division Zixibacteria bacterium CG_4_9_14_3_um_filter_46_8]
MCMTDPIADMLTRIRNASKAKKRFVDIPNSKIKEQIARILVERDFISKYAVIPDNKQGVLRIRMRYTLDHQSVFSGMSRVSSPGRRTYLAKDDLKAMSRYLGTIIISTSQGVLAEEEAIKRGIGGEAICRIW